MASVPTDPALYERVKRRVYRLYPRHSAYRSGRLVLEYKKAFSAKHRSGPPYSGRRGTRSGLNRWFAEEWRNQRGGVGYAHASDVYRPTRRVTRRTPLTFGELTPSEVRRARRLKSREGRVKRFRPPSQARPKRAKGRAATPRKRPTTPRPKRKAPTPTKRKAPAPAKKGRSSRG